MQFFRRFAKPQIDIKAGSVYVSTVQKMDFISTKIVGIGTKFILTRYIIALTEDHAVDMNIK